MKKRAVSALFLALLLLLSSCGREVTPPAVLLAEFLGEGEPPPAGTVYSTDGEGGTTLSDSLIASLYARADGFCEYGSCVESAAVYLSERMDRRFEAGVFLCYGSADTKAVAEMCHRRAAFLSRFCEVVTEVECRGRAVYYKISEK